MPCEVLRSGQTCQIKRALLAGINEAGCEAEQLTSLLGVMVEQLDDAHNRIDIGRSVKEAANVGRIARGISEKLTGMVDEAEECCAAIEMAAAMARIETGDFTARQVGPG